MMKHSLFLGKPFDIGVYVHWTFSLLLIWVALTAMTAGIGAMISATVLVLLIFTCVVLHELGHSLAARRFGIPTHSIILLPMGGVAQLAGMPNKPWQELVIAVAGPAVNVAIAIVLTPFVIFFGSGLESMGMYPTNPSQMLTVLLISNIAMVVFNMIPAFPMDGGRVLRSLLAMGGNQLWATNIAAGLGQGIAVLFALGGLGVLGGGFKPILLLVAVFIFLAAGAERRMVRVAHMREQMFGPQRPAWAGPVPPPIPSEYPRPQSERSAIFIDEDDWEVVDDREDSRQRFQQRYSGGAWKSVYRP